MKTFTFYLRYIVLRGFLLGVFVLIILFPVYLQTPQISLFSHLHYNHFYNYIKDIQIWLFVVYYLIFVFIMSFVLIFVYMMYYYLNNILRKKAYNQVLNLFTAYQFEYMYTEEDFNTEKQQNEINKIKTLLNSDYKKSLFLNLLRKVNVQIIGKGRFLNLQMLNALKYNYLIYGYLHSPLIRHKLFALKIISDFKLEGYDDYILKLINKKNNILRSDALISILKLNRYDNLHFLSDSNIKLTIWDIDVMVKTIQQKKLDDVQYLELINSKNAEISALGIILVRINKHIEFKKEIKDKISNTNQLVSDEAFFTFISFADNQSDYDYLMYTFVIASEKAQLYIIHVIKYHDNTEEKIKFLNWVIENNSLAVKIEAIRILIQIDMLSVEQFKQSNNSLIRNACLQVLDYNLE